MHCKRQADINTRDVPVCKHRRKKATAGPASRVVIWIHGLQAWTGAVVAAAAAVEALTDTLAD